MGRDWADRAGLQVIRRVVLGVGAVWDGMAWRDFWCGVAWLVALVWLRIIQNTAGWSPY